MLCVEKEGGCGRGRGKVRVWWVAGGGRRGYPAQLCLLLVAVMTRITYRYMDESKRSIFLHRMNTRSLLLRSWCHIEYISQAELRCLPAFTLPRLVTLYDSTFQLTLTFHFPRNVNCMLYRLLRLLPQLIRQLLRFFTPLLDLWVRPFKVERQIEVCLILALGNGVVDEGACIKIAEVDL